MDDAKDVLHTVSQNYDFGGEVASYLLSVASPGLINKVKHTAPPKALVAAMTSAVPEREQPRSSWLGRLLLPEKASVLPAAQPAAQVAAAGDKTEGDSRPGFRPDNESGMKANQKGEHSPYDFARRSASRGTEPLRYQGHAGLLFSPAGQIREFQWEI